MMPHRIIILKRCYMTLLEVMIVIAILFGLGSIVTINLRDALIKQRFKNEVEAVVDYLRFAQNLMLVMEKDVHVYFESKNGNSVKMSLEISGKPLVEEQWIERSKKPVQLKYVRYFAFNDLASIANTDNEIVDVRFMSHGFAMSRGKMILSTAEGNQNKALTRYVYLKGYPMHIYSQSDQDPEMNLQIENPSSSIDQSLTSLTLQEMEEQYEKAPTPPS